MILRSYQQKALDLTRASMISGNKKIALTLATGAGKSIIAKKIVEGALNKGKNVIYLTYRNVLIEQMKKTFSGMDIEFMTLQKHLNVPKKHYDLVIIDEVHWSHGSKLQNTIDCDYLIGLTATPITPDGYALEFDDIIDVVQLKDLVDLGYASPIRVLSTAKVDTKSLKGGKEFTMKSSFDMMAKSEILKDIVKVYTDHAKGLKTIIYAVNIEHAEQLKNEFIENGIECDTVHSKKDTLQLIDDFRENRLRLLINVDILTTGLDLPDIYCLILASPTKSIIKATQIYGRATRLDPNNPNKEALIIDCCEVIKNTQHPYQKFDFTKRKSDKKQKKCNCGSTLKIIDKKVKPRDEMMFNIETTYRCSDCGYWEVVEDIKVLNFTFCEGCNEVLEAGSITYKQSDNKIEFTSKCSKCEHEVTVREILLSEKELKEIAYEETMSSISWDRIKEELKIECKRCGYKWQYSERLMDTLQSRKKTPEEALAMIEKIRSDGHKVSKINFME